MNVKFTFTPEGGFNMFKENGFFKQKVLGVELGKLISYGFLAVFLGAVAFDGPNWLTYPLSWGAVIIYSLSSLFCTFIGSFYFFAPVKWLVAGVEKNPMEKNQKLIEAGDKLKASLNKALIGTAISVAIIGWLFMMGWTITATMAAISILTAYYMVASVLYRLETVRNLVEDKRQSEIV